MISGGQNPIYLMYQSYLVYLPNTVAWQNCICCSDLLLSDQWLLLMPFQIHFWVHSVAPLSLGCFQPMTEHIEVTSTGPLLWRAGLLLSYIGSRCLHHTNQTFIKPWCSLGLFFPTTLSYFIKVQPISQSEGSPYLYFPPYGYFTNQSLAYLIPCFIFCLEELN